MSRSNNPGRKDFAKPVPSNNAGQGDLLLQPPTDKLNPFAGSDYVEKRQWHDRSRNRDTAFVAAWETSQWWGHVQGQTRLIGRSVRRLSYRWMLLRRFCSASAQPKNLWITRTAKVMGWGTQAFQNPIFSASKHCFLPEVVTAPQFSKHKYRVVHRPRSRSPLHFDIRNI